jgi:hypothetical protein
VCKRSDARLDGAHRSVFASIATALRRKRSIAEHARGSVNADMFKKLNILVFTRG